MTLFDKVLDAPLNLLDKVCESLPPVLDYYKENKNDSPRDR